MSHAQIVRLNELSAVRCPCGFSRRAFAQPGNAASMHVVDIEEDARAHYHKKMTEIYLVLEGSGQIELDGKLFPIEPMSAIYIPPCCRHRAVGRMKILNIAIPAFDETDEWFD